MRYVYLYLRVPGHYVTPNWVGRRGCCQNGNNALRGSFLSVVFLASVVRGAISF